MIIQNNKFACSSIPEINEISEILFRVFASQGLTDMSIDNILCTASRVQKEMNDALDCINNIDTASFSILAAVTDNFCGKNGVMAFWNEIKKSYTELTCGGVDAISNAINSQINNHLAINTFSDEFNARANNIDVTKKFFHVAVPRNGLGDNVYIIVELSEI